MNDDQREELLPGSGIYKGLIVEKEFEGYGVFQGRVSAYAAPYFHVEYPEDGDAEDLELSELQELLRNQDRRHQTQYIEQKIEPASGGSEDADESYYEDDDFENDAGGEVAAKATAETEDIGGPPPSPPSATPSQVPSSSTANTTSRLQSSPSLPPLFGSLKMSEISVGETVRAKGSPGAKNDQDVDITPSAENPLSRAANLPMTALGPSLSKALHPEPPKKLEPRSVDSPTKPTPTSSPIKKLSPQLPMFEKIEPKPPTLPDLIFPGGTDEWKTRLHASSRYPGKESVKQATRNKTRKIKANNLYERSISSLSRLSNVQTKPKESQPRLKQQESGETAASTALYDHPTLLSLRYPAKLQESTIVVLERVAEYMDRHHIRLIDLFSYSNGGTDGSLSASEFRRQLRIRMGLHLSKREVHEIVRLLDTNGDGDIEMKELESAVREMRRRTNGRELMTSFQQHVFETIQLKVSRHYEKILEMCFNLDPSGVFTVEAFQKGLRRMNTGLTDREIKAFTKMLDPAHRGIIEITTIRNCVVFR